MDIQLRNDLKANAFIALAAFAIFWFGYGLAKGLMFGCAVFIMFASATAVSHWWRSR